MGIIVWIVKAPPKALRPSMATLGFIPFFPIAQSPLIFNTDVNTLWQIGLFFTKAGTFVFGSGLAIVRFIDPEAEFAFIPADQTTFPEGYEPFDIPGVRLTHRRGHCTFHTMLREYTLKDSLLEHIASIINEADEAQDVSIEPAAAGLDLVCRGLRLISPDDRTALQHGRLIYEALYA